MKGARPFRRSFPPICKAGTPADVRFTVLASGSKGNALVVQAGGTSILVDAGLGPRTLKARLQQAGLADLRPHALVITHGHDDHVRHAPEIAEAFNIPTYATPQCAKVSLLAGRPLFAHQALNARAEVRVGAVTFRAFSTPHDTPGSVGFVFDDGTARAAVVTDLGCTPQHVLDAVRGVDLLYAEFNHDVQMLHQGPYPASLKRRCLANTGHLSNVQGAALVGRSRTAALRTLLLAHLSETNNSPQCALLAARAVLDGSGVAIHVAPQHQALPTLEVHASRRHAPVVTVPELVTVGAAARPAARRGLGSGPTAQLSLFGE